EGPRRVDDLGRHERLGQDVDRAAAGQPDVPGRLVADPVANHAGVARLARAPDLFRRGALDAAAADRAKHPAVLRDEEDGAFGPRRRAERPDDDGPPDRQALGPPRVVRLEELAHRSAQVRRWAAAGSAAFPSGWAGRSAAGAPSTSAGAWAAASLPRRMSPPRAPARTSPRRSRLSTVPAGRKSSMYGRAARIPAASGW